MAITFGIILAVILALLIFIATRPATFRIERGAQISAPAAAVFALLNDFHQWHLWSPWEKFDPNMKKTFEGATAGPGAIYAWNGNKKVGEGRMTLLETKADERVSIKLQFFKPFSATNQTTFTLAPSDAGTRIAWIMDGKHNFMGKAFSLFMDMDKMIGKDFEQGLANLNIAAQTVTAKA